MVSVEKAASMWCLLGEAEGVLDVFENLVGDVQGVHAVTAVMVSCELLRALPNGS